MRQTNPIWPGWPGRSKGGQESPPGHDGAKQTQFGPRQNDGQVVCRKGVMAERTCKEHWRNKAKLGQDGKSGGTVPPGRGLLCDIASMPRFGKQSQFGDADGQEPALGARPRKRSGSVSSPLAIPGRAGEAPIRAYCAKLYKQSQFADRDRDERAKQSQFGRGDGKGQVRCGQGVMANLACPWHRRNKANCPKRGTEAVSAPGRCEGPAIRAVGRSRSRAPATGTIGLQFRAVVGNVVPL